MLRFVFIPKDFAFVLGFVNRTIPLEPFGRFIREMDSVGTHIKRPLNFVPVAGLAIGQEPFQIATVTTATLLQNLVELTHGTPPTHGKSLLRRSCCMCPFDLPRFPVPSTLMQP